MSEGSGSRQSSPAKSPPKAPGDILHGTDTEADASTGRRGANSASMVGYSRAQAFADPSHAPNLAGVPEGGVRTQETSSEEGLAAAEEE